MAINIWIFIVKCIFCIGFIVANVEAMVGGNVENVQPNEFPYVTSIIRLPRFRHQPKYHLCTGTLVSKQDVLTIGHCIEEENIQRVRVMVGAFTLNAGTRFVPLRWRMHSEWALARGLAMNSVVDDVAIIRLTQQIPDTILHANLWYIPTPSLIGFHVRSAGWGSAYPYAVTNIMQKMNVRILSDHDASNRALQILGYNIIIDPKILYTASDPYSLLQSGDSGGPLLCGHLLIGINIGTTPMQGRYVDAMTMNIHFNVNEFRRFIEEFMGEPN